MMRASLKERPTASMLLANCQVETLKASEIQYAITNEPENTLNGEMLAEYR